MGQSIAPSSSRRRHAPDSFSTRNRLTVRVYHPQMLSMAKLLACSRGVHTRWLQQRAEARLPMTHAARALRHE